MVYGRDYDSHPWARGQDGRMRCPDCGTVDLADARRLRQVLTELLIRGWSIRR